MSKHTLQEFFDRHKTKSVDYRLRAEHQNGTWCFYIHPQNVDGETWNFELKENQLTCTGFPSTLEE